MDLIGFLINVVLFVLWLAWSIIWWVLSFFIFPLLVLLVLAAVALRFAYRSHYFRPYVEKLLSSLSKKGLDWIKRALYAVTITPIRVLLRLLWLVPLHALINLLWRPRWDPIERARQIPSKKKKK